MKMSNDSIGARMATALGLVLALLLGAALFGIAALYRTLGTYDTTVQQRVAQERAVSRMESEFKTQVLEWKNTLLRGEDSRKRELHWNAFQASEKRVADAAKALEPQLTDAQEKAALQKFTQAHAQMAQGYRKGFEVFQSLGFVPSAGDADVADIDQGPAKLLTELSQQVAASSAAIAQEAAQDARRALFSSLVALALVTALGACAGWLLTRSVVRPLGVAVSVAHKVAAGDLTTRIEVEGTDEPARLLEALRAMQDNLENVVSGVRSNAEGVASASAEIAQGNADLSLRTEEQASSLDETTSSMQQLQSTVQQNASNAQRANELARNGATVAQRGVTWSRRWWRWSRASRTARAALPTSLASSTASHSRPTSSRSMPPSRPRAPVNRAGALPWWPARCATSPPAAPAPHARSSSSSRPAWSACRPARTWRAMQAPPWPRWCRPSRV